MYILTFENFIKESNVHYYGVQDMEKIAAQSGSSPSRFSSADSLVKMVKQYFKPESLSKLSDGKVSIKGNSKNSFHILTKEIFDMRSIEKELINFAEIFMKIQGPFGVRFTLLKPNDIFVELDLETGISIVK